jgi:peptidoglycan-N-acetylglucosamine deacetylase
MKRVALTFDDGPYFNSLGNKNFTQEVLDGIEQINQELAADNKRIYVTFFVQGTHTDKSTSSLSAITNAGHEIGNHAWHHDEWTKNRRLNKSDDDLVKDVIKTHNAINRANGAESLRLFRPPLGHYTESLWRKIKAARELSNYILAGWDYHPESFPTGGKDSSTGKPYKEGFKTIAEATSNNRDSVYLLHEQKPNTVKNTLVYLKNCVPIIKSGQISFVKASDLIKADKRTGLTLAIKGTFPKSNPNTGSLASSGRNFYS